MSLFAICLRRFVYFWPGRVALFLSWLLATTLLAGVAMLEPALAGRSFAQVWQNAPAGEGHILLEGATASLDSSLAQSIAYLLENEIEVRQGSIPAGGTTPSLQLWSFSDLAEGVQLLAGHLPENDQQAAIGPQTAQARGLSIGDQLDTGREQIEIVAFIQPLDPLAARWWGDLTPFASAEALPLIMTPAGLAQLAPDYSKSFRLVVDRQTLLNLLPQAGQLATALTNLDNNLQLQLIRMETGLPQLLHDYQAEQVAGHLPALFMVGHVLLLVGAIAWLVTPAGADLGLDEKWLLSQRGGSFWQLFWLNAAGELLLAGLAGLLGPLLAVRAFQWWFGRPLILSSTAWIVALLIGVNGWVALVWPMWLAWPKRPPHPAGCVGPSPAPSWLVGPLFLLLGGASYWQLAQSDSNTLQQGGLLNLSPLLGLTLLAIGLAWLVWTIWDWLIWPMVALSRPGQRLITFLAARRLRYQPLLPGRSVALLALLIGLLLAGWRFQSMLHHQQVAQSSYMAGADLRLNLDGLSWSDRPGVTTALVDFYPLQPEASQEISTIVALDPATFAQVVPQSQAFDLGRRLGQVTETGLLPAIFSQAAANVRTTVGDQFIYLLPDRRRRTVTFEVAAVVDSFPGLSGRVILVNRAEWLRLLAEQNVVLPGRAELWLRATDASALEAEFAGHLVSNRRVIVENGQSWLPAQYSAAALGLAGWWLALLGLLGWGWLGRLSGRGANETTILTTLGFSSAQLSQLSLAEWLLVGMATIPAGLLLAWLLIQFLTPYLSLAMTH